MSIVFWGVIVVLVLLVFFFIRARHAKNRITAIIIILLILFIYITASQLVRKNQINLKTTGGVWTAVKVYFSWLGNAAKNVGAVIGNAVKMDWGIKNKTAEK